MQTKKLDIGDIVKLTRGKESVLGRVTDWSDDFVCLNNRNEVFKLKTSEDDWGPTYALSEWDYEILYSDFDK